MTNPLPTPRPWMWDGDDLWHMGDGYGAPGDADTTTDPHRFTGITIDKRLRESPVLKANMALIVEAVNNHAATRKATLEEVAAAYNQYPLTHMGFTEWLDTQIKEAP